MRVQTEEWRRFIPGVQMYNGKKTLFYNGEKLFDEENLEYLIYDEEERDSWEVIIVLPGVEVIYFYTFNGCSKVETVIMSDTVRRIEEDSFYYCKSLVHVKFSRNLEFIGEWAFCYCESLTSIFILPSCREIGNMAFNGCKKMIMLSVPQHTQFGERVIDGTALMNASPMFGNYYNGGEVNTWIQNRLQGDEFALHRACSSYNPLDEVIYGIVKRHGLKAFKEPDSIGITPVQYLEQNPFADIDQQKLMKRFILHMMGEIVN